MFIALIIGLITLGVVALFFLFRWLFSPFRIELRKARRACRRKEEGACERYEYLKNTGHL